MKLLLLLPVLFFSLAAKSSWPSSLKIEKEREILVAMAQDMDRLVLGIKLSNEEFTKLREAVRVERYAEAREIAVHLRDKMRDLQKIWRALEKAADKATKADLKLNRLAHDEFLSQHEALDDFVAFKVNVRFGHGSTMEHMTHAWQGLDWGKKTDIPPRNLKQSGIKNGVSLDTTDFVAMFLNNGGFVRGEVVGWTREDQLVLREIMPIALTKYQKRLGNYRVIAPEDWRDVASLEIFKLRNSGPTVTSPISAIGVYGEYSKSANRTRFKSVRHIDFHPPDMDLLNAILGHREKDLIFEPVTRPVDVNEEKSPKYPAVYFLSGCEEELS